MDAHECGIFFVGVGCAGGAVGFVANDQIEFAHLVFLLGLADAFDGMVGREDDAHVLVVVALFDFAGKFLGVGGRGVSELVNESLDDVVVFLALLADLGIGTNCKAVERDFALLRPFGE